MARHIMLQGCTSDAGKSFLVALLCRALANQNKDVMPFKAQNMSNNAAVTQDGAEMGRAQWLQAIAANKTPSVLMNPILMKPSSDTFSQVVINGEVNHEVSKLPWQGRRDLLWPHVTSALNQLEAHDIMVIEGAGSPAEVNLRAGDIVNMSVALHTQADVYLIADINRGGAYAHLLGTYMCLSPEEQTLIKGFVLNRFRGDESLLTDANDWIYEKTGIEIVAVIPELTHQLPEEDAFNHQQQFTGKEINIGLIGYPWASNLDEFDALFSEPGVNVVPILKADNLTNLDALILPGSKNSVASLKHLKQSGLADAIKEFSKSEKPILGLCGGMQIMGDSIDDRLGVESIKKEDQKIHQGLGLLPIDSQMKPEKIKQQTQVTSEYGFDLEGYEIHCGISIPNQKVHEHTGNIGWRKGHIRGSYLHDLLMNTQYRQQFLQELGWQGKCVDWHEFINHQLNDLSGHHKIQQWVGKL